MNRYNSTSNNKATASASQAWAILNRHAQEEIKPLRLQELCCDNDRVSSLVSVHTSNYDDQNRILIADLSRQRMTTETLNHLLRYSSARNVKYFVKRLAWGQNDFDNPFVEGQTSGDPDLNASTGRVRIIPNLPKYWTVPSMHMSLRVPHGDNKMLLADGRNALDDVHSEWDRIHRLSDSIRKGILRGSSGMIIKDILVVGRGVAANALKFMYEALRRDKQANHATYEDLSDGITRNFLNNSQVTPRRMHFITSIDPAAVENCLHDLRPGSTLIINIALHGNEDTGLTTKGLKNWLLNDLSNKNSKRPDTVVNHHMFFITSNERLKAAKPENTFLIPEHSRCEPFITFTAAGLLPLSVVFGWKIVEQILAGAHDMDKHFVETNPRHNLPILLALTDLWNDVFLGLGSSAGRIITPFSESFLGFSEFVSALEAQTCGRGGIYMNGKKVSPGVVVSGGVSGNYDRLLYQGGKIIPSELIISMETQTETEEHGSKKGFMSHDALICSFFAHADVLAFGSKSNIFNTDMERLANTKSYGKPANRTENNITNGLDRDMSFSSISETDSDIAEGNRPSTVLVCGRCDAFTCGQLVALSEHRAFVSATLWDIDPFVTRVGTSMRSSEVERLRGRLTKIYEQVASGYDDEDDGSSFQEGGRINLATSTILKHYANRMRDRNR